MGKFENALPDHVLFAKLDQLINWGRSNSMALFTLDLACCGVEIFQTVAGRYDAERFGSVPQVSPEQADVLLVGGTVTYKVSQKIREIHAKMAKPCYVVAIGSCANSGGPFSSELSYSTVCGVDQIIPVDVFVPGCPPRPEAILNGLLTLRKKIERKKVLVRDELA